MKIGKISEGILKRSVLKQIKTENSEMVKGAGVGADCAFYACNGQIAAYSMETVCLPTEQAMRHAIIAAANNIAAGGGTPGGVLVSVLLPAETEEEELKRLMKLAAETGRQLGIPILGGHTEITDAVSRPVITAAGIGCVSGVRHAGDMGYPGGTGDIAGISKKAVPGQDVIVSKWVGLEGTALIAGAYEKELLKRYPFGMVQEAKGFDRWLSIVPEAAAAVKSGVCAMHDVRGGGIFGALWELAESAGVGLTIDLAKIPVKQVTIEVCEYVDVNPYELLSGGMLLMTADRGEDLAETLFREGIPAAVIGKVTNSNDRIICNEDEVRFLEPPRGDEIYRVL